MPQGWFNHIVRFMLRSPLHGIMSSSTMLLTYTGRKSGKKYTLPIGYLRQDDTLTTITSRSRVWWRNLRRGADVTVLMQGKQYKAHGEVVEDQVSVVEGMIAYLSHAPQQAKYFNITLKDDGTPDEQDLAREAKQSARLVIGNDGACISNKPAIWILIPHRWGTHAKKGGLGVRPLLLMGWRQAREMLCLLQEEHWIDLAVGIAHQLEVQMRAGGSTGETHRPDHVPRKDRLAAGDVHQVQMGIE